MIRTLKRVRRALAAPEAASSARFDLIHPHQIADLKRDELEAMVRQRTQYAFLGGHKALCRSLGRYKLFLDTRDIAFASHLFLDGFWEMWLTQFMARTIKSGMVVVDVGAFYGYYTTLMSDFVGPEGKCIAIEPNPEAAAAVRESLSVNGFTGRTEVLEVALRGPGVKTMDLYVPRGLPMNARLLPGAQSDSGGEAKRAIPVMTLDQLMAKYGKIDFLKIDAEGAEHDIIRGGDELLRKHKPRIILEFNQARLSKPRELLQELLMIYREIGVLTFDSTIRQTSIDEILADKSGEDWLLYLGAQN